MKNELLIHCRQKKKPNSPDNSLFFRIDSWECYPKATKYCRKKYFGFDIFLEQGEGQHSSIIYGLSMFGNSPELFQNKVFTDTAKYDLHMGAWKSSSPLFFLICYFRKAHELHLVVWRGSEVPILFSHDLKLKIHLKFWPSLHLSGRDSIFNSHFWQSFKFNEAISNLR